MTQTRVISVLSAKGGIGQSTISLDWARAIGQQGQRCLLVELAGGDLAWNVGAMPQQFIEEVASGIVELNDAVVQVEENVGLLASGNAWSAFGPEQTADVRSLLDQINASDWKRVVVDLGTVSHPIAEYVITASDRCGLLMQDDIACVARTYALLRRLGGGPLTERTSLVFNRIDNSTDAASLNERFSQLTSQFLNHTWPLLGTVPDGPSEQRVQAIAKWGLADVPTPVAEPASIEGAISNRPFWADN